ncbi:MAG: tRNA pseudouridine(38-40) synthase TruA [Chlamydiota bacterium]
MKNILLVLAYDGSPFLGWQKTRYGKSIEETLQNALEKIFQEPITLQAASRTDAKVHAKGQIVNFFIHQKFSYIPELQYKLNSLLPKELCVLHVEEKPLSFHPTLDPVSKEYHYYLCTTKNLFPSTLPYVWHYPNTIDFPLMQKAFPILLGTHDFSSFTNKKPKNAICSLYRIEIFPEKNHIYRIEIEGNRFLYNMMRILVGTLANIGSGKIQIDALPLILQNHQRKYSGITAPPHGLFLAKVSYPTFAFDKRYVNPLL